MEWMRVSVSSIWIQLKWRISTESQIMFIPRRRNRAELFHQLKLNAVIKRNHRHPIISQINNSMRNRNRSRKVGDNPKQTIQSSHFDHISIKSEPSRCCCRHCWSINHGTIVVHRQIIQQTNTAESNAISQRVDARSGGS